MFVLFYLSSPLRKWHQWLFALEIILLTWGPQHDQKDKFYCICRVFNPVITFIAPNFYMSRIDKQNELFISDNVNVPCQRVLIERNVTVSLFIKNANQVRQKIQLFSKVEKSLHFYMRINVWINFMFLWIKIRVTFYQISHWKIISFDFAPYFSLCEQTLVVMLTGFLVLLCISVRFFKGL